jgi:hypothetical protein
MMTKGALIERMNVSSCVPSKQKNVQTNKETNKETNKVNIIKTKVNLMTKRTLVESLNESFLASGDSVLNFGLVVVEVRMKYFDSE